MQGPRAIDRECGPRLNCVGRLGRQHHRIRQVEHLVFRAQTIGRYEVGMELVERLNDTRRCRPATDDVVNQPPRKRVFYSAVNLRG